MREHITPSTNNVSTKCIRQNTYLIQHAQDFMMVAFANAYLTELLTKR